MIVRRQLLQGLAASAGGLLLAACDRLTGNSSFRRLLGQGEAWNQRSQRLLAGRDALAREFSAADLSPVFRANGNQTAKSAEYRAHLANSFAEWRLAIDGMVVRPLSLSLADLAAFPQRTQITRHDCVEGWSAIGQWTGPQLGPLLKIAGLSSRARFIVFHCADDFSGTPYYESIDMVDAMHPQTLLALQMNGAALPEAHGAPVRMRVERQLGYKQAKYVMRIEAVESLSNIGAGKGGYWEDVGDYPWYAGI